MARQEYQHSRDKLILKYGDKANNSGRVITLPKEAKIYTLENQNGIFYVGQTCIPLKYRLRGHETSCRHNTRLSTVINESTFINIEEVESCPISEKLAAERYWIMQFKAWGFDIVNLVGYKGKPKKVKPNRTLIPFTDPERNLINAYFKKGDANDISNKFGYHPSTALSYFRGSAAPPHVREYILDVFLKRGYEMARLYYRAAFQVE